MGKCVNCNRDCEVQTYSIKDSMGTRYRDLCSDCANNLNKDPNCILISAKSETGISTIISDPKIEPIKKSMSNMYKAFSIVIAIVGFIIGITLGKVYPILTVEYEYPSIQMGDTTTIEHFNLPIMLYAWVTTVIVFFLFWAIYCHLKNQESVLSKLEAMIASNKNKPEDDQ